MSIEIYSPSKAKLVHKTKANFGGSMETFKKVSLMQYDKNLPVIAVELYKDKEKYILPSFNVTVKVKWKKPDKTFVYKDVLGCNKDRTIVYFEADEQMTYSKGNVFTILELIINGEVAGSSPLNIYIEENPIQSGDIESAIEMPLAPVALTGDYNDLTNKPEGMKSAIQDYEDELPNIDDTNDDEIARLDSLNIHYPKSDSTIVKGQFNHIFNENGKMGSLINIVEMINEINQNGNVIYSYDISACTARPYPADFSNYWQLNFHGTDKDSNYLRFDFEYPMLNFNLLVSTGFNINSLSGLIAADYDGCMLKFEYYDESGLVGNDKILLNKAYKDDDPYEFNLTNYNYNGVAPFTSVIMYAEYYDEGYTNYKINLYQMHIQFNNNLTSYKWSKVADEDDIKELENKNLEQDDLISNNEDSINDLYNYCGELEGKIGDVPIYRVLELPLPRSEYSNAIYKLEDKYYICKNFGESKYTPGDLSELTYNQNPISQNYYPIISGMLDNYLRVTAADKVYSDYGRLKFSSSSALGQLTLHKELDLPMTKITLHLIPYNSLKASVISIKYTTDGGASYNYIADHFSFNAEKDYTFNSGLPRNGTADIIIQSDSETSLQDRRFYISSIALEFGRSNFEWTYFVDGFELETQLDNKQNKIVPGTSLDGPITVVSSSNDTEPLNIDYSNEDTYFISIFDRDSGSSLKMDMNVIDECAMYVHFPTIENMNDVSVAYEEWVNINYSKATNIQNGAGLNSIQQKESSKGFEFDNPNYTPSFTPNFGAKGKDSVVLNGNSEAYGELSTAEGRSTLAIGARSHTEGTKTVAANSNAHAEGLQTVAGGEHSHAEGILTQALGLASHTEGQNTIASLNQGHAEGLDTQALGYQAHSEGKNTIAEGDNTHAEGEDTKAIGFASHVEGIKTVSGSSTKHGLVIYQQSRSDTYHINTSGNITLVSYNYNVSDDPVSEIAIDNDNKNITVTLVQDFDKPVLVRIVYSINGVEPGPTPPPVDHDDNICGHSEGYDTETYLLGSHAEGRNSSAIGFSSHAQGYYTIAFGDNSFATGEYTEAISNNSSAFGEHTICNTKNGIVMGKYNVGVQGNLFELGTGTSNDNRYTNLWVDQNGMAHQYNISPLSTALINRAVLASEFGKLGITSPNATDVCQRTCTTNGYAQVSLGYNTKVTGEQGVGIGVNVNVGSKRNVAIGNNLEISNGIQGSMAVGLFNYDKENLVFQVGNGSFGNRSNAFEVYQDGHAEIQTVGNTDNSLVNKKYLEDNAGGVKLYKHTIYGGSTHKLVVITTRSDNLLNLSSQSDICTSQILALVNKPTNYNILDIYITANAVDGIQNKIFGVAGSATATSITLGFYMYGSLSKNAFAIANGYAVTETIEEI